VKVKVLFVEEAAGFGGSASILATVSPHLRRLGYEIHIVLANEDPRAIAALGPSCDALHVLPYRRRSREATDKLRTLGARRSPAKPLLLAWLTLLESARTCRWLTRLGGVMKLVRPHIVHGNNGPGQNATALLLAKGLGSRAVTTVRGGSGVRSWIGKLAVRSCDLQILMSEHLRKSYPGRKGRALVVYDGLDLSQWPMRRFQESPSRATRFGHLGMLTPWKGQDVFLRAAVQVAEKHPDTEFYVFGDVITPTEKAYADELAGIARSSPHGQRIHFMGFQPDVQQALSSVDVLVHSSVEPEPFGMVVLEGMAMGLAVIASDAGGPREVICHGKDGLLVEPGRPELLAEAMGLLARDRGRVRSLGMEGRKKVERAFRVEETAARLDRLYTAILSS